MSEQRMRVLLVEDEPDYARLIRETLAEARGSSLSAGQQPFQLEHANRLSVGLERLAQGGIDVVLLDLGLPDSYGLETFTRVATQAPEVPVVVITVLADEQLATQTVRLGAQDYLVKGQIDSSLLVRSLRYAIERHRFQAALHSLSLVDDLTGLYNRRGFFNLTDQSFELAARRKWGLLLLYADLDGLKEINDTFGHLEGDRALTRVAQILKETFRAADIIARIGGDEFAVLAIETPEHSSEILLRRLRKNLEAQNREEHRYTLSLSIGTAWWNPDAPCSMDELLAQADRSMYHQKRSKKRTEE